VPRKVVKRLVNFVAFTLPILFLSQGKPEIELVSFINYLKNHSIVLNSFE